MRHTVKKRVTGLSFTTGLVIRISHDEDPRSLKPSINSMSPSLVHFIGYMKRKRFMSNSSRELCIMFKNICNKETFPVSDWISSSWLAFWSCPIFYIIRWNYNFYKVLHHVEKGGWSRFSLLCKLSLETLKTTAAHFTHSFLRYNACMLGCARLLDTKAPSLKQPFKKE